MSGYMEIENMANQNGHGKIVKSEALTDGELKYILDKAETFKPLLPCQDYSTGKFYYGVIIGEKKHIVNSAKDIFPLGDIVDGHMISRHHKFSKSEFSVEGLRRFRAGDSIIPKVVFETLKTHFGDHAAFTSSNTPAVISLWTMGTYIYQGFDWYGYLHFTSPAKRSGKSQCLGLISMVAFNSTAPLTTPTLAYLFREVAANGSTICLDEVESLRGGDKEKYGEIMALLNVGFKRGATVGRCEKGKDGNPIPVDTPAYGPKVFAGISHMIDTLEDRSFKIVMLKKKPSEKIKRFDDRKEETALNKLKDDLYIFGLNYGPSIVEFYNQDAGLEMLLDDLELDDRAKDIFGPLFAIAGIIDRESPGTQATEQLKGFALEQKGIRDSAEMNDDAIVQAVEALAGVELEDGKRILTPGELLDLLKEYPALHWLEKSHHAGRLVSKLGIKSKPRKMEGKTIRGYLLTVEIIEDLKERYLPPSSTKSVTPVTSDGESDKNATVTKPSVTDDIPKGFYTDLPSKNEGMVTEETDLSDL